MVSLDRHSLTPCVLTAQQCVGGSQNGQRIAEKAWPHCTALAGNMAITWQASLQKDRDHFSLFASSSCLVIGRAAPCLACRAPLPICSNRGRCACSGEVSVIGGAAQRPYKRRGWQRRYWQQGGTFWLYPLGSHGALRCALFRYSDVCPGALGP